MKKLNRKTCLHSASKLTLALWLLSIAGCLGYQTRVELITGKPGDPASSLTEVTVEASQNPNSVEGVKYIQLERWDEARGKLLQAVRENPRDHQSLFAIGVLDEREGHFSDALKNYDKAFMIASSEQYAQACARARTAAGNQTPNDKKSDKTLTTTRSAEHKLSK